jgi:hypothetical protein
MLSSEYCLALGCSNRRADVGSSKYFDGPFSPVWTYALINGGNNGDVYPLDALAVLKANGALPLSQMLYNPAVATTLQPNGNWWQYALNGRITDVKNFSDLDTLVGQQALKAWLHLGHVVIFLTAIDKYSVGTVQGGIHSGEQGVYAAAQNYDHELTIVGYDDGVTITDPSGIVHLGAYKVVNSWGTGPWGQPETVGTLNGQNGFLWVSYDVAAAGFFGKAAQGITISSPIQRSVTNPYPDDYKVVAQVHLRNVQNRGNFSISFYDLNGSGALPSNNVYSPPSWPLQKSGSLTEADITVAFDITPLFASGTLAKDANGNISLWATFSPSSDLTGAALDINGNSLGVYNSKASVMITITANNSLSPTMVLADPSLGPPIQIGAPPGNVGWTSLAKGAVSMRIYADPTSTSCYANSGMMSQDATTGVTSCVAVPQNGVCPAGFASQALTRTASRYCVSHGTTGCRTDWCNTEFHLVLLPINQEECDYKEWIACGGLSYTHHCYAYLNQSLPGCIK